MLAQPQTAYFGYVSSSIWWQSSGSWSPFTVALPDSTVNDSIVQGITRTGSAFTFASGGIYTLHANFNAYDSDAYISLRLNGISSSKGIALERTTYHTNPTDQNEVQLDGIFSASAGDTWVLEYFASGTTYPWVTQDPLPGGASMNTGEVSIVPIPAPQTQNISFTGGQGGITYGECVFIAGNQSTQSTLSQFSCGARSFDTTQYPAMLGSLNRYVKFIATLQNTSGATKTTVQLYDVRNSIVISGTTLDNSSSRHLENRHDRNVRSSDRDGRWVVD